MGDTETMYLLLANEAVNANEVSPIPQMERMWTVYSNLKGIPTKVYAGVVTTTDRVSSVTSHALSEPKDVHVRLRLSAEMIPSTFRGMGHLLGSRTILSIAAGD